MTATTYAHIPFPVPAPAAPCADCGGQGVTGDRYQIPADEGRPRLLIDVFCPTCKGCGSADHTDCPQGVHHDDEMESEDLGPECISCDGREWIPVPAWNATNPNGELTVMRLPCGCAERRAVPIEIDDDCKDGVPL